jgi:hypothetical protein
MIPRLDPSELDARDLEVLAEVAERGGSNKVTQFQADPPAVAD